VVAHAGAEAVPDLVPGAGVVDREPTGTGQPVTPDRRGAQRPVRIVQQAQHLTLGDVHAEGPEQGGQACHGGLTLMIERHHEALEAGAEVIPAGSGAVTVPPSASTRRSRRNRTTWGRTIRS
jgi:hypothetical protein